MVNETAWSGTSLLDVFAIAVARLTRTITEKPHLYEGWDWDQLTREQVDVFEIDPLRWPRMVIAWAFYEALVGVVVPAAYNIPESAIEEGRARWPSRSMCLDGFSEFAVACGLTRREAHAVYYKIEFSFARGGLLNFSDEQDGSSSRVGAD
jgi:hypothetical protein